jgi:DNA-binding PucR family transcriptional regulator
MVAARKVADRLQRYGLVGISSFYLDPGELGRGVQEAELMVDVLRHGDGSVAGEIGGSTYKLLLRMLASHPDDIQLFYEATIAPVVRYDEQYGSELARTFQAYLDANCNMNATAGALFAHRHTIAYRFDRIKELTGLDPTVSEDRERLGLGLKVVRLIAARQAR